MATTPTNLPVPSESARDLKFNAGKIDEFVTSLNLKYADRFGGEHYTIEGLRQLAQQAISAFGWVPIDSFQDGATLTLPNQVLSWKLPDGDGDYYRWDGAFPKVVPVESTPESTGGIGAGKWLSVGDAVLRTQISDPDGATKYPALQIARWRDTGDIRGWGAIEGTDCSDALQAAIKDRAVKHWGTSSTVIMNGPYRVDKKVLIPTDLRLIGNWASITSSLDDYIFESAYVDDSGELVSNWYLSDDEATAKARLKGTTITGITFVDCAKVMRFRNFNERCGLQDLYFERCGVAWEMVTPFYSFFNNIFIRSTKEGYEEWYACYLGRQSNLVDHFKVSITERKYGTLLGDIDTLPGKKNVFYEMISMRQCSWEHVDFPVTIEMDGYAFKVEDLYAEVISGPLFRIKSGDQYDMKIGSPIWLAGVENFGEFKGLKGRSEIFQGSQNDYKPSKPASILLEDSTCLVRTANENGYGNRINFDSSSTVELEFPIGERLNNITNYQVVTNSIGEVYENINKKNVVSVISGDVLISTKIKKSKHNMLVISIDLNNYDCGAVFIGIQQINQYGYTLMIDNDIDGYTTVIIKNTGLSGINEVVISGCIRYV